MKRITAYQDKYGGKHFNKVDAIAVDKIYALKALQNKCHHRWVLTYETRRRDVGHHDWEAYQLAVATCSRCKKIETADTTSPVEMCFFQQEVPEAKRSCECPERLYRR